LANSAAAAAPPSFQTTLQLDERPLVLTSQAEDPDHVDAEPGPTDARQCDPHRRDLSLDLRQLSWPAPTVDLRDPSNNGHHAGPRLRVDDGHATWPDRQVVDIAPLKQANTVFDADVRTAQPAA
jgi:hypothetical protein